MGVNHGKPSRDFTRPLGMPRCLKGLLHMLNALVSLMKATLCLLLLLCFQLCFAKGLAKCKFGGIWSMSNGCTKIKYSQVYKSYAVKCA